MTLMSGDKCISPFHETDNFFKLIGTPLEQLTWLPSLCTHREVSPTCSHPSMDTHNNICLDILEGNWSTLYVIKTILLFIQNLLSEPNLDRI
ncbi:hypothetical protein A6R68_12005 [Neotoma lepida]|uniref:UBC core domain-containing protein n=1 Tax=Neotoma lepida TaxID=56216 RepID=A0A1A6FTF9_NEOLE|nr:hypothetical protein A6R68_12005 [Neotoma lepida]